MLFNSVQYAAFLYAMVLVYWMVPARHRLVVLLLGSYAFYATWNLWFLVALVGESLVAWFVGRTLPKTSGNQRKQLLGLAVVALLAVLLGLKIASGAGSAGTFGGVLNISGGGTVSRIALPVGISFYTFQIIAYLVDVYRDELEPRPLLEVLTFVGFFPHLLSGPISRGRRLFPQLEDRTLQLSKVRWAEAFELIGIGLFQKVVVADTVRPATSEVLSRLISDKGSVGSFDTWIASFGTLLWLVTEFTGYSNIARGSAKLFGIELPYNFRQPLTRTRSIQDFWRRHHLTLMAWFRDYVARPLHRRDNPVRNELATVLVFVLSGMWHGLSVGWLVWGLVMGTLVVTEQRLRKRWRASKRDGSTDHVVRAVQVALIAIIGLLACAWIVNTSLGVEVGAMSRLVAGIGVIDGNQLLVVVLGILAVILIDRRQVQMEEREGHPDPITLGRAIGFGGIVAALVVFSGTAPQRFLYFNF